MSIAVDEIALEGLAPAMASAEWASGELFFVGDVGGTNARLGFGRTAPAAGVHMLFVRFAMNEKKVAQLAAHVQRIVSVLRESGHEDVLARVVAAAVSVPGPASEGGTVAGPFNNLEGLIKISDLPRELFPAGRSALLNDIEAGGYGVRTVSDAQLLTEYFAVMWEGTSTAAAPARTLGNRSCFVIAPGTGLGTSFIHPISGPGAGAEQFSVLSTELGCTTTPFRPGSEAFVMGLSRFLQAGRKPLRAPISECLVCGPGLLYAYLVEQRRRGVWAAGTGPAAKRLADVHVKPSEVARRAKAGNDPAAVDALLTVYKYLIRATSEASMIFLPFAVVVVGDNIVRNSFLFEDPARLAALRAVLDEHTMQGLGFIARPRYLRQVKPVNLNLLGCFGFAATHAHTAAGTSGACTHAKL